MDSFVFDSIEQSFRASFPESLGWERASLGILLSYENDCTEDSSHVDCLKYGAMHALRWGREVASSSVSFLKEQLKQEELEECTKCRRLGGEFVGVFGCQKRLENNVLHIESENQKEITFCCDPNWFAYELLDQRLNEMSDPTAEGDTSKIQAVRDEILAELPTSQSLPEFFSAHVELFKEHRSLGRRMYRASYNAPEGWTYLDVSLRALRNVWDAIGLLALLHGPAVAICGYGETDPCRLLLWKRCELVEFLKGVSDESNAVEVALNALTYSRSMSPPDIAIQPFVPINEDFLVASPWMVVSSDFERNFFAVVARCDKKTWDNSSEAFSKSMGENLQSLLENKDLRVATSVSTPDGSTDLDLIIWSPKQKFLLTAELKWMIAPADLMEVLNRGEKTCLKSLKEQLPKHQGALANNASEIIKLVFNIDATVDSHDSILICRGFTGTSRLPDTFPCIDERVFRLAIDKHDSLSCAVAWLQSRAWLAKYGEHYTTQNRTIKTPTGHQLTFPVPVFPH